MKENVLDVLLYIFENFPQGPLPQHRDPVNLREQLEDVGFPQEEIEHAFNWLEGLSHRRGTLGDESLSTDAIRLYALGEALQIPTECRGFLLRLEQLGILGPETRETIIDRALALASEDPMEEMDIHQFKWVTLLVLLSEAGDDAAFEQVEQLLFDVDTEALH